MLFIDANQYLHLYTLDQPQELLTALVSSKAHIFVTQQIVDEVFRNKLWKVAKPFLDRIKKWTVPKLTVDDESLSLIPQAEKLKQALKDCQSDLPALIQQKEQELYEVLHKISVSDDNVSKALSPIFAGAVEATDDEWERARKRRERGNPPGKQTDPLGDQLSWEQLVTRSKRTSKIWIISSDNDFSVKVGNKRIIDALLHRDLSSANGGQPIEVFCFDILMDGINHFAATLGKSEITLPSKEEAERIKQEELRQELAAMQEQENLNALLRGYGERMLQQALVQNSYYEANSQEGAYHAAIAHEQQFRRMMSAAALHSLTVGQHEELPPQVSPPPGQTNLEPPTPEPPASAS